jgi:hypothetical protein
MNYSPKDIKTLDPKRPVDNEWQNFLLTQNMNCLGYNSISSHTNTNTNYEKKKVAVEAASPPISKGYLLESSPPVSVSVIGEERVGISTGYSVTSSCCDSDVPPPTPVMVSLLSPEEDISPICEDLYISTKTKVLFFNTPIDIHNIFWKIPVIEYWQPKEGILKKQMKIVSKTPEEYKEYRDKLKDIPYYVENIIKQIDNPEARSIKFKDERKITIGISKKDIMNYRGKVKNAFYNCFALIFRFRFEGVFREIHVKIFNTGKMEIPGVLNNGIFEIIKKMILDIIQPHVDIKLTFIETDDEHNILINSNFNCGYYINLEKLYSILRSERYRIESAYEPCSYPGVKCKYYFNNMLGFDPLLQNGQVLAEDRSQKMSELGDNTKYTQISFMIFRTGSCLIVGNCSERVLQFVFTFIKQILSKEYGSIRLITEDTETKAKKTKIRKKSVIMTSRYFANYVHPEEDEDDDNDNDEPV